MTSFTFNGFIPFSGKSPFLVGFSENTVIFRKFRKNHDFRRFPDQFCQFWKCCAFSYGSSDIHDKWVIGTLPTARMHCFGLWDPENSAFWLWEQGKQCILAGNRVNPGYLAGNRVNPGYLAGKQGYWARDTGLLGQGYRATGPGTTLHAHRGTIPPLPMAPPPHHQVHPPHHPTGQGSQDARTMAARGPE